MGGPCFKDQDIRVDFRKSLGDNDYVAIIRNKGTVTGSNLEELLHRLGEQLLPMLREIEANRWSPEQ